MTIDTEHQERTWRLAKAEMECQGIEIEPGVWSGCFPETPTGRLTDCPECHGTGRVPLLSGVRVTCICIPDKEHPEFPLTGGWHFNYSLPPRSLCYRCGGLGYVPTTDSDIWAQELWPLLREREPTTTYWVNIYVTNRACGDFPAALGAAEQALVAGGVL